MHFWVFGRLEKIGEQSATIMSEFITYGFITNRRKAIEEAKKRFEKGEMTSKY